MASSAFGDRTKPPDVVDFVETLGTAAELWASLVKHVVTTSGPTTERWGFAGEKVGWSARLLQGGRIVVYLTPQRRAFTVGVVLGERALAAAAASRLPKAARAALRAAPRHAEGRGVRLQVRSAAGLRAAMALIDLKLSQPRRP
jgi:hypothetical protein